MSGHELCVSISAKTGAPIRFNQRLELIPHARRYFPAVLGAIENATRSIEIEIYRFYRGRLAAEFSELLLDRADRGVKVTLVLDGYGCRSLGRKEIGRWRRRGIAVGIYNPISLTAVARLGQRNHRKLVVVDGVIAFTGGMNIDDLFSHHASVPWRETMVRAEGAVVSDMRNALANSAAICTPPARSLVSTTAPKPTGNVDAQYVTSRPSDRNIVTLYVEALGRAKYTAYVTTPYFLPPPEIVNSLIAAAGRGVDVRILTPGRSNNIRTIRAVSRALYGQYLRAGVRIFEYEAGMMHAKSMVVDGGWVTLGSANLDCRSLWRSLEANLVTCDRNVALDMENAFGDDLKCSTEITQESLRQRSISERFVGRLARPLRTLM